MFLSLRANKKRIIAFLVLAAAVVAGCLFMRSRQEEPEPVQYFGETAEERLSFLQSFGWETEPEPTETREVMIPQEFNDVYQNYNAMQQAQGFDLAPFAGEVCTQYKYHITNYPGETEVYATLLVYGRLIIGGDLACAEVDGFMHGFAKDSAYYGEATPRPAESSGPNTGASSGSVNSGAVENTASQAAGAASSQASSAQDTETQPESAPAGAEGASDAATDAEIEYPTD